MSAFTHVIMSTTAAATMAKSEYGDYAQPTATLTFVPKPKGGQVAPYASKVGSQTTVMAAAMMLHAMALTELAASPYGKQAAVARNDNSVWFEICEGANVGALMHLMQKVVGAYNQR